MTLAESIYQQLNQAGFEAVLDDRNERAGVKFKDADLIGYPLKVTLGPKAISEHLIEVKVRKTNEVFFIPVEQFMAEIALLWESI
jgi:prolyl-tRNA synthetase